MLPRPWAATGKVGKRHQNLIRSLFLNPDELEYNNQHLRAKYDAIQRDEVRFEAVGLDEGDLDLLLVAYGTMGRICKTSLDVLREAGVKAGLLRPISLFPFPHAQIFEAAQKARKVLAIELSTGQMVEDVDHAVRGTREIWFYGKTGGNVPPPDDIAVEAIAVARGEGRRRPGVRAISVPSGAARGGRE